jgi:hypothetical protein
MNNVVPFPGESENRAGSDGGGPEDPMLEQRVGRLEEKVDGIEAILVRLEPQIKEILLAGAKQADINKLQSEVVEIKNRQPLIDGRLAGIDGRLSGIGDRFASLPTVWTMLGIVFTTWALGSGILIFAMNYLRR